ncbi:hypothetical protein KUCAC02_004767 [Chaenocephalus aceratus]|uniref:Uncharacterized protein n=1 Tax=Chaenocephalus aceratus TaxID=36190 RepID=A0ACB9X0F0_CHAAC|nr:hypothetical protein KUCAC02_004767 [Chaenocephalus aceratus]
MNQALTTEERILSCWQEEGISRGQQGPATTPVSALPSPSQPHWGSGSTVKDALRAPGWWRVVVGGILTPKSEISAVAL